MTSGITRNDFFYALQALVDGFYAPEAATGEISAFKALLRGNFHGFGICYFGTGGGFFAGIATGSGKDKDH